MTLQDHIRVIIANWWRILLVAVVLAGLTYAYSNSQPNVYSASTLLNTAPGLGNDSTVNLTPDELAFRAEFYAAIAKTPAVAGSGALNSHLKLSLAEAERRITTGTNGVNGFILL